ncbi:MAG TPA: PHP domain-containing protein [Epulopiscium sp.]|nr:PHP domain-containing protein [Candidatus Epulonipiscium sp.]
MNLAYDFHIHTAASPCADETMTPNNIVNMALLKALDAIAITDHNNCANVKAVMDVAKDTSLIVIPGMEIETSEEFHTVVLFESLEQVIKMEKIVHANLPNLNNRKDIFGDQTIYNADDEIIGEINRLLLTATALSVYDLVKIVKELGGVCYPAHIDRPSNSIISSLGSIPPDLEIQNIEVSRHVNINTFRIAYPNLRIIQSSDAHYLGDMFERQSYMEMDENTPRHWVTKLRRNKKKV